MSRIRHSVCRWCYHGIPLEDLCIAAKDIGISSIELVMPDDMTVLEKHGLGCAMIMTKGQPRSRATSIPSSSISASFAFQRLPKEPPPSVASTETS